MILETASNFDWTWILTAIIALVTFALVKFTLKIKGLPPGPIPLPIIGNLLHFRGETPVDEQIYRLREKYGDVFTVWVGPDPTVVVCGYDEIKDALVTKKTAFAGKVIRYSPEVILNKNYDIVMSDYGPQWEALRKMAAIAVRKYSVSDNLPLLVDDIIKQVVPLMLNEKEAFHPDDYIYLAIYNVLATTVFGKRYDMKDEEFLNLKTINDAINDEFNMGTILDVFPILRFVLRGRHQRLRYLIDKFIEPIDNQYQTHKKSYKSGMVKDFTDACLAAKEEAETEDKGTSEIFTDKNMVLVLFDIFSAGTDTTRITLLWILLFISNYPEVQERIRSEVKNNMGEGIPVQEDKNKCPYTMAVITEILRMRPPISFTLEHKSICDTELAGYRIPNQTSVVFHLMSQHMNTNYWKDPKVFRPERFLDEDGKFVTTTKFASYLPFGMGRRACPGEKLALADLFLLLTGLVQKCRFSLPDGPGSGDFEPKNIFMVITPKPYKLKVEKV